MNSGQSGIRSPIRVFNVELAPLQTIHVKNMLSALTKKIITGSDIEEKNESARIKLIEYGLIEEDDDQLSTHSEENDTNNNYTLLAKYIMVETLGIPKFIVDILREAVNNPKSSLDEWMPIIHNQVAAEGTGSLPLSNFHNFDDDFRISVLFMVCVFLCSYYS